MLLRQVLLNEDQKFCSISYLCCGHQYISHSGRQPAPINPDNCDRNSQAVEQSKEFQGNAISETLVYFCRLFGYVNFTYTQLIIQRHMKDSELEKTFKVIPTDEQNKCFYFRRTWKMQKRRDF